MKYFDLTKYVPQDVLWCIPAVAMIVVKDEHQTITFVIIIIVLFFSLIFRHSDLLHSRIISNEHMGDTHTTIKIRSRESISGFKPGQFVTLSDGHRSRKYTPLSVSRTNHGTILVFAIRKYPLDTAFSSYLYTRSINDIIVVNGPFGRQYYDGETKTLNARGNIYPLIVNVDTVVLLSGGSGLAPMYILAKSILTSGIMVILVTADTSEETAMLRVECQALAEQFPQLLQWKKHVSDKGTRLQYEDLMTYKKAASCAMCMCGPPPLLDWVHTVIGTLPIPLITW